MNLYIKKGTKDCHEAIVANLCSAGPDIYAITTPRYSAYSIYLLPNAKQLEEKVLYMVEHPIADIGNLPNVCISLPVAAAYNSNMECIGYMALNPHIGSIELTNLTVYQRRPMAKMKRFATRTEWHGKFERDAVGMVNRIKLLYNICKALHLIPKQYVPAYISPEQILVTATGKVTITNLVFSEILDGDNYLYPAGSLTPDYLPAEGRKSLNSSTPLTQSAALFAYAVIFYQVLTGTHPYGGTILKAPYDKCIEISQCIENHLFPFGERAEYITLPENFNLHETFNALPAEVQTLFKRAFGSNPAARPTLEEWGKVFYDYIISMK